MRGIGYALAILGVAIAAGCGNPQGDLTRPDTFDPTTPDASLDSSGGGGLVVGGGSSGGAPVTSATEPQTCDEAVAQHSYIGCDYWPTVIANNVWSIFDYAVVVANVGTATAGITITGPVASPQTASVPPGQLVKMYLPWVPDLKGPDTSNCGYPVPFPASVLVPGGAFHLVSTSPVTVYQFNALEYRGAGGPTGKNWSACPGDTTCPGATQPIGCFSFTNDASLLLPSTAMTGNYRVAGHEGIVIPNPAGNISIGPTMTITATQDATSVKVRASATAPILGGQGLPSTPPGGTLAFSLDRGGVAELAAPGGMDLSGSLVQASAPVQVITGVPCVFVPPTEPACDHVEESVFPAETLGKDYIVAMPAGPTGTPVHHRVRIYGNVDGTTLTYNPSVPPGCPTSIGAGEVVECGAEACPSPSTVVDPTTMVECGTTSMDFEVKGNQPFSVGTFTMGAFLADPAHQTQGDPSQSFAIAVEQFRTTYVFLAPSDYTVSYVDIVAKAGTTLTLDGKLLTSVPTAIGTTGYGGVWATLGRGQAGAHTLVASSPIGIQVIGYGSYTSYMYPGGLDLAQIATAPPPIQ